MRFVASVILQRRNRPTYTFIGNLGMAKIQKKKKGWLKPELELQTAPVSHLLLRRRAAQPSDGKRDSVSVMWRCNEILILAVKHYSCHFNSETAAAENASKNRARGPDTK